MNSFKSYLESQGKSKSTISHYQRYLLDFLSFLDGDNTEVENATAKEVMNYLNHLKKKGQQNKTRAIRLGAINHFFDFKMEFGHIETHPSKHIKIRGAHVKRLHDVLTRKELESIFSEYTIPKEDDPRANRNWFSNYRLSKQRNKVILSLLIHQGLTTAEINRLGIKDLKLREGEIFIAGSRKSCERVLQLKSSQIMDLMEYNFQTRPLFAKFQKEENDSLFLPTPVVSQKYASRRLEIWKGLTREIKEQNTRFINFKQVRASVITHWLSQYNLREVQQMAGHRYISSTERYLSNQIEDLKTDIEKFHPLG